MNSIVSLPPAYGEIRYIDRGTGPPIVFVHGVFVNGLLWRRVIERLEGSFRCIAPTLPLGAHDVPLPDAHRTPRGVARLIADFIDALDLHDVTLVGNDTGGALCQLVIAQRPERIARIVLTNCDSFENFPPPVLRPLYAAARLPGFFALLALLLRARPLQRLFMRSVAHTIPAAADLDRYFDPLRSAAVRNDLAAFMRTVSPHDLPSAAAAFAAFSGRALVVWGEGDLFFPLRDARRLAAAFGNAPVVRVAGSRTFVPEDQPMVLAESIERFVAATVAV